MADLSHKLLPRPLIEARIELVDIKKALHGKVQLRCKRYGQIWPPKLQIDGKLPPNFWKCPIGCNLQFAPKWAIPFLEIHPGDNWHI